MDKGCILPFPKKGDLGIANNYRGITLTSIAAKIYNALIGNRIEPKIEKTLRKNQNGFPKNLSTTSQIWTICRILKGVNAKNLETTILFVDFSLAFSSMHREDGANTTRLKTAYFARWVDCSPMVWETWVQSQVVSYQKLLKWYLIPPCLTLSNIRYVSRVKWSNPGKGVAPSPTSRCSSNWKGSLQVTVDYGRHLNLLTTYPKKPSQP